MLDYPTIDHTGEVYFNRKVTSPDKCSYYKNKPYWSWNWICLDCGKTGTIKQISKLKNKAHNCNNVHRKIGSKYDRIPKVKKYVPKRDYTKICSEQCKTCIRYKRGVCNYYLDTGRRRTQVNLLTEPCPHKIERHSVKVILNA